MGVHIPPTILKHIAIVLCLAISPELGPVPPRQLAADTAAINDFLRRMDPDSLAAALSRVSSPVTAARLRDRRVLQRRAHAAMLLEVVRLDGLSTLLSATKYRLLYDYSLPHDTLYFIKPVPQFGIPGIPIPEDWTWPPDPWKRTEMAP